MNIKRMIVTGVLGFGLMNQSITHCFDPKYTNMLKWTAVAASATAAYVFSGRTSKAMDDCWLLTKKYNKLSLAQTRFNAVKKGIQELNSDSTREQVNALKQDMDNFFVDNEEHLVKSNHPLFWDWIKVLISYKINPYPGLPIVGVFSGIETRNEDELKAERVAQIDIFKQSANRFESDYFKPDQWIQLRKKRDESRSAAQWNGICSILAGACSYGLYRYVKSH